jgi:hypothetical protein
MFFIQTYDSISATRAERNRRSVTTRKKDDNKSILKVFVDIEQIIIDVSREE